MFEINLKKTSEEEEEVGQRKLDGKSAKAYGFIWRLPTHQFQNLPNLRIQSMQCTGNIKSNYLSLA